MFVQILECQAPLHICKAPILYKAPATTQM